MARNVDIRVRAQGSDKAERSLREMREEIVEIRAAGDRATDQASEFASQWARSMKGVPVDRFARDWARSMQSAAASSQSLARVTSGANQVMFTAGDALQDFAAAGGDMGNAFRFMGNNVAFGAEQFALLRSQTGNSRAALSALASSLMGVGGVIVGVQLAVSVLPALIDALSSTSEEAEEAKKAIDEAAAAVFNLVQVSRGEVGVRAATRLRDRYEAQSELLQEQVDRQERIRTLENLRGAAAAEGVQAAERLTEQYGRLSDEELEELKQDLNDANALLEQAEKQLRAFHREMRLEKELRGTILPEEASEFEASDFIGELEAVTVEFASWEELISPAARRLMEARERAAELREEADYLQSAEGQRLLTLENQIKKYEEQIALIRERARRGTLLPQSALEAEAPEDRILSGPRRIEFLTPDELIPQQAYQDELDLIQQEMQTGLVSPLQAAQYEANVLRSRLQLMLQQGIDPSSEGFQRVREDLTAAQEEAQQLGLAMRAAGNLSRGFSQAVFQIGVFNDEVRTAQDVLEELGRVAVRTLEQIAQQIAAAALQAFIFRTVLGIGTGGAGSFVPAPGPSMGGGPMMAARRAPAPGASGTAMPAQVQLVARGEDLVGVVDLTRGKQSRRG